MGVRQVRGRGRRGRGGDDRKMIGRGKGLGSAWRRQFEGIETLGKRIF